MKDFCFAFQMLGTPCKQRIRANERLRQRRLPLPSHLMIQRQPLLLTRSPLTQNMLKCSARVQDARSTLKTMYATQRTLQTHVFVTPILSNLKTRTLLHPNHSNVHPTFCTIGTAYKRRIRLPESSQSTAFASPDPSHATTIQVLRVKRVRRASGRLRAHEG
jgi:hypothetical protein